MSLNYDMIAKNVISERVVVTLKAIEVDWFHVTYDYVLANFMIDSIHVWMEKTIGRQVFCIYIIIIK